MYARRSRDVLTEHLLEDHLVMRSIKAITGTAGTECLEADIKGDSNHRCHQRQQGRRGHELDQRQTVLRPVIVHAADAMKCGHVSAFHTTRASDRRVDETLRVIS
ncbi:MAG: hypothetical protein E6J45_10410 [Chloroflexi bacterium]|nr:MAG: hypothetical protein E6J45_10410 [Chloroflexota bacterium]